MRIIALSAAALTLAACETVGGATPPPEPMLDRSAEIATLMAADRAVSAAVATSEDPGQAYAEALESSALYFGEGQARIQGAAAIGQMISESFSTPGYRLTWSPDMADVSDDATVGYTVGSWESINDGDIAEGSYMTVWRRGLDGVWRASVVSVSPSGE